MFLSIGVADDLLSQIVIGIDGNLGEDWGFLVGWAKELTAVEGLLVLGGVEVGALGHQVKGSERFDNQLAMVFRICLLICSGGLLLAGLSETIGCIENDSPNRKGVTRKGT